MLDRVRRPLPRKKEWSSGLPGPPRGSEDHVALSICVCPKTKANITDTVCIRGSLSLWQAHVLYRRLPFSITGSSSPSQAALLYQRLIFPIAGCPSLSQAQPHNLPMGSSFAGSLSRAQTHLLYRRLPFSMADDTPILDGRRKVLVGRRDLFLEYSA